MEKEAVKYLGTINQSFSLDGSQGLKVAHMRITDLKAFGAGDELAIARLPNGIYIHQIKILARNAIGFTFDLGCFDQGDCETPEKKNPKFFLDNYLINNNGCLMPPCCSWSCGNDCVTDCCPTLPAKDGCSVTSDKFDNPLLMLTVCAPVTDNCAEITLVIEYV